MTLRDLSIFNVFIVCKKDFVKKNSQHIHIFNLDNDSRTLKMSMHQLNMLEVETLLSFYNFFCFLSALITFICIIFSIFYVFFSSNSST